ncbi:tetratricopeptide repeat protein [Parerythrobacter lacustris]|uniref:Sel1 repeat family protein n=1 Tax=Parerythrobacter lacustris TaxID=2969984 RepID=A0ABT1XPV4_9SPHN|nr:tetratricopeptide repeat protein [Parerythrobacter lacustris]MCR2832502.1 sel1 repeat family protein [Parerythrobacter lacustris]
MQRLLIAASALLLLANSPREDALALIEQGKMGEAIELIRQAADAGDVEAMTFLGMSYEKGQDVAANPATAATYYRMAADRGDPYAQWRLGIMIDSGAVEGSPEQAVELFRKAADQGNTGAMASLAVMLAAGKGLPQDFAEARRNYEMAARKGNAHGLQGLGVLHLEGQGVPQDKVEAMALWLVALSAGDMVASANFQKISYGLNDDEVHAINKRANAIATEYGYEAQFTPWRDYKPEAN